MMDHLRQEQSNELWMSLSVFGCRKGYDVVKVSRPRLLNSTLVKFLVFTSEKFLIMVRIKKFWQVLYVIWRCHGGIQQLDTLNFIFFYLNCKVKFVQLAITHLWINSLILRMQLKMHKTFLIPPKWWYNFLCILAFNVVCFVLLSSFIHYPLIFYHYPYINLLPFTHYPSYFSIAQQIDLTWKAGNFCWYDHL